MRGVGRVVVSERKSKAEGPGWDQGSGMGGGVVGVRPLGAVGGDMVVCWRVRGRDYAGERGQSVRGIEAPLGRFLIINVGPLHEASIASVRKIL